MAQHTPGPWVADCEEGSFGVFAADDGREIARLHDKNGNFPQSSFADTQYLYAGQHEANAILIAAAPDLLAALKLIESKGNNPGIGVARDIARAAIRLATAEVITSS